MARLFAPSETAHAPAGLPLPALPGADLEDRTAARRSAESWKSFGPGVFRRFGAAAPRVLLVDDNAELRSSMRQVLQSNGFDVTACCDARQAEQEARLGQHIDLLLTDLEMPGRSGAQLASSLTASDHDLPVLIVSGSIISTAQQNEFATHGWSFLSKPCKPEHLLSRLLGLLANTKANGALPVAGDAWRMLLLADHSGSSDGALPDGKLESGRPEERPKGTLLLIGDEPLLQRTRALVLQRAGYTTISRRSSDSVEGVNFDDLSLALVCRSVSMTDAVSVVETIHAVSPSLPILRLGLAGESALDGVEFLMTHFATPTYLLAEVDRLVTRRV